MTNVAVILCAAIGFCYGFESAWAPLTPNGLIEWTASLLLAEAMGLINAGCGAAIGYAIARLISTIHYTFDR